MKSFVDLLNASTVKAYAGIGSRETPPEILVLMGLVGKILGERDWTLRSGGADKADLAFEIGCQNGKKEIFLPWPGFNRSKSTYVFENMRARPQARAIAQKYHPRFAMLKDSVQNLHSRNVMQALGETLRPSGYSDFVLCWTIDGEATGGTGQALRISMGYNIPIFNLKKPEHLREICETLNIRWPLSEMKIGRDDNQIASVKRIISDLLKRGDQIERDDEIVKLYA